MNEWVDMCMPSKANSPLEFIDVSRCVGWAALLAYNEFKPYMFPHDVCYVYV